MNNGKFVKIDRILEKTYRDYGFSDLDWISCVEWIAECLDFIGVPKQMVEKATDGNEDLGHPECIDIVDNRGTIPCDIDTLVQAFRLQNNNWIPMRATTDTTFVGYNCKKSKDFLRDTDVTYKLNKNHILTSFDTGKVVMIYLATPTDEDGYPMIPDNIKYITACAAYIADKMVFKQMIQGKQINPNVVNRIEQDKSWYISAANSSMRTPTLDELESWKNNFVRLIPNINSHDYAFRNNGKLERRYNSSNKGYRR